MASFHRSPPLFCLWASVGPNASRGGNQRDIQYFFMGKEKGFSHWGRSKEGMQVYILYRTSVLSQPPPYHPPHTHQTLKLDIQDYCHPAKRASGRTKGGHSYTHEATKKRACAQQPVCEGPPALWENEFSKEARSPRAGRFIHNALSTSNTHMINHVFLSSFLPTPLSRKQSTDPPHPLHGLCPLSANGALYPR